MIAKLLFATVAAVLFLRTVDLEYPIWTPTVIPGPYVPEDKWLCGISTNIYDPNNMTCIECHTCDDKFYCPSCDLFCMGRCECNGEIKYLWNPKVVLCGECDNPEFFRPRSPRKRCQRFATKCPGLCFLCPCAMDFPDIGLCEEDICPLRRKWLVSVAVRYKWFHVFGSMSPLAHKGWIKRKLNGATVVKDDDSCR